MKKVSGLVVAAVVAASLGCAVLPAHAEGDWASDIYGVGPGFKTREWEKKVDDGHMTAWKHKSCNQQSFHLTLLRQRLNGIVPDKPEATHSLGCTKWYSEFGRLGKGKYKFQVIKVNGVESVRDGALPLDVSDIKVHF